MLKQITWKPTTQALGRNGLMQCGGIDICHNSRVVVDADPDPCLILRPLTSKGKVARCSIEIPANKVVKVVEAMAPEGMQACCFVEITSLVPRAWRRWFWDQISENAPFAWGTNNRTLVTASSFADYCEFRLDNCEEASQAAKTKFLKTLRDLGETYIDLEN